MRKKISKLIVISSIALSVPMITMTTSHSSPTRPKTTSSGMGTMSKTSTGTTSSSSLTTPSSPKSPLKGIDPTSSKIFKPTVGGSGVMEELKAKLGESSTGGTSSSHGPGPKRAKTYKSAIHKSPLMGDPKGGMWVEEGELNTTTTNSNKGSGSLKDLTTSNEGAQGDSGETSILPNKSGGSGSGKESSWNKLKRFFKK